MPGIDPFDRWEADSREREAVGSHHPSPRSGPIAPAPSFPDDPELGDATAARTRGDLLWGGAMLAGSVASILVPLVAMDGFPLVLAVASLVLACSGILRVLRGIGGLLPARRRDD